MIVIQCVKLPADIKIVAVLAREIWEEHYVPIIGREQVDYMLEKFQSVAAITRQIADGYEYYLVMREGSSVGYFALVPNVVERSAMLSKIYVRQAQRGGGIGKAILGFVEGRCLELGLTEVWLTVNRNNAGSIAFYRKRGFAEAGSIVQDIGNGFVMDDYKMVKVVGAGTPEF